MRFYSSTSLTSTSAAASSSTLVGYCRPPASACSRPVHLDVAPFVSLRAPKFPKYVPHGRRSVRARAEDHEQLDEEGEKELDVEEDSDFFQDEEYGIEVGDFDDVTIVDATQRMAEYGSLIWADYLAINVEGATVAEIEGEEKLAGVEVQTSPLAASLAAAAAAAVAEAVPGTANPFVAAEMEAASVVDPEVAAASATTFFEKDTLSLYPDHGPLSEWDLRAAMEKRRRMENDRKIWIEKNLHSVGRFRAVASDWRTDVRIKDTGDPTQPDYREWTLKEIWDLITQGGTAMDPRNLAFKVESPSAKTDFVAEGFYQHPEVPEFLAMQGKLIKEEDEAEVLDPDSEALLASEFSDMEDFGLGGDQLVDSSVSFESGEF